YGFSVVNVKIPSKIGLFVLWSHMTPAKQPFSSSFQFSSFLPASQTAFKFSTLKNPFLSFQTLTNTFSCKSFLLTSISKTPGMASNQNSVEKNSHGILQRFRLAPEQVINLGPKLRFFVIRGLQVQPVSGTWAAPTIPRRM